MMFIPLQLPSVHHNSSCDGSARDIVEQGSQTRGPRATCGRRGRFVCPAMLFGNFQIINFYVAKCLEKRCREIIESKLGDIQCGFRPGRSTTHQILLSSKLFRNLGSMPKTSTYALSTLRKHTTGFLVKSFGECCGSGVLTAAC